MFFNNWIKCHLDDDDRNVLFSDWMIFFYKKTKGEIKAVTRVRTLRKSPH